MAHCSMCQGPILWAKTEKGKRMPLSLPPDPNGNVMFDGKVAHVLGRGEAPTPGVRRYRSHFTSCEPYAARKAFEARLARAIKQGEADGTVPDATAEDAAPSEEGDRESDEAAPSETADQPATPVAD